VTTHESTSPCILFEDVSFTFVGRGSPTLEHIHLQVYPGESLLLTGATGSGKSTLLRCMCGLIPHLSSGSLRGTIRIADRDPRITSIPTLSRHVNMVLQTPDTQICTLRVEDEIAFGLKNLGVPADRIEERVDEALTQVGLNGLRRMETHALSGGQKQRLVIGAALAMGARILLLDEPLSQLDPLGAHELTALLRTLRDKHGYTFVLVEHRLDEVIDLVDRLVVLDGGRKARDLPAEAAWRSLDVFRERGLEVPALPDIFERLGRSERPRTSAEAAEILAGSRSKSHRTASALDHGDADIRRARSDRGGGVPVLAVEGLTVGYAKGEAILKKIGFRVGEGERVAIVGRNGSGKSTLLGCLAGILSRHGGRIFLGGEELRGMDPRIALVLQDPDLMLMRESVEEEIVLSLHMRGIDRGEARERTKAILHALRLQSLKDDPPLSLSRGERLRVAIGALLAGQPEVLLLDEPTSGQDRAHLESIWSALERRRGLRAILFSTHDMDDVLAHADRVLVLEAGRIIADASPRSVLGDASLRERAGLLAPPPRRLAEALGLAAFTADEVVEALR